MTVETRPCPTLARCINFDSFAAIRSGRTLTNPLSLRLFPGTVLGVVGPNGVGKSSFLSALAHAGVESIGVVRAGDRNFRSMRAQHRASTVALLSQDLAAPGELRVKELVAIGARAARRRNPHRAAQEALEDMGVAELSNRRFGSLSGGQKQLVQLSRVFAQDTPLVILDEPTSALDLYHQKVVAEAMQTLRNRGKIVIAALHDLNYALQSCTQILLLDSDGKSHIGAPLEVLQPDLIHAAYGVQTTIHTTEHGHSFISTH
ncbi:MAG: ABC transporter ATP-binding protein [Microbacteriaceae bacterium]|nr:ABC transporter ATP-binding protein [Microbacteriaceae bacterium]